MSASTREQPEESSPPGVPAWMLTYADTVTLLMTFFVMLMSFSTLDEEKFSKVRGSLMGYLGVVGEDRFDKDGLLLRRNMESGRVFMEGFDNPPEYDPMSYLEEDLHMRVHSENLVNALQYHLTDNGLEIHIMAGSLFEPGTATFRPSAMHVLDLIGNAVRYLPHNVRVQATGDILFMRSLGFTSRQHLAITRAARVCEFLAQQKNVKIGRLQVAARIEPDDTMFEESSGSEVRIVVIRRERKWVL